MLKTDIAEDMQSVEEVGRYSEKAMASAYVLRPSRFPNALIYRRAEDDESEKRGKRNMTSINNINNINNINIQTEEHSTDSMSIYTSSN